jgi:Fe-S cluster assembly protein SufD
MSLALDNKTSTAQLLLNKLSSISGKNEIIGFEEMGAAIQYLEEKGIPTNKDEEYKYCNIDVVFRKEFKNIENNFSTINALPKLDDCINVYMHNGNFNSTEVHSEKITISDLKTAAVSHKEIIQKHFCKYINRSLTAATALNSAFANNGLFIYVPKSVVSQKPICIHYLASNTGEAMIHPRLLIVIEANAELNFIEKYYGYENGKCFATTTQEIIVGNNAKVNHYRVQAENANAYSVSSIDVQQGADSVYNCNTFIFGGALVRNNHHITLNGKNGESHLNGLLIANDSNLIDNHTLIDHAVANCNSNELYKGIANDKATAVFNGKIMVRRDAQKTNAYQSSKNILMSDDATVNTKPQLEIFADDVKCSHGTSTGKVDEEALFYLKARGIGDTSARRLLLQAFAQELIDKIEIESLQEEVLDLFEGSLK